MGELSYTTAIFIVILILIEIDKILYKKLDDDYKRYVYRENYHEKEEYYKSRRIIQVMKNIEYRAKRTTIKSKVIGFIALLLIIVIFKKPNEEYLTLIGRVIVLSLTVLGLYCLYDGIRDVNNYKKEYNKESIKFEILSVIIQNVIFLIMVIGFIN